MSTNSKAKALYNQGSAAYQRGEFKAALQYFIRVSEISPSWVQVYIDLGNCYRMLNNDKDAYHSFEIVNKLDPNAAEGYWGLGLCLSEAGIYEQALKNLLKSYELKPQWPYLLLSIVKTYFKKNDHRAMVFYGIKAFEIQNDLEGLNDLLGYAYYQQEQYENAKFHLLQELRSYFLHYTSVTQLALCLHVTDEIELALQYYDIALESEPDSPFILEEVGTCCYKLDHYQRAIQVLTKAVQIKPDEQSPYYFLAASYIAIEDYKAAEKHLKFALTLSGDDNDGLLNQLGKVYFETGKIDEAERCLNEALAIDDCSVQSLMLLGEIFFGREEYEISNGYFERILAVEAESSFAYENIGKNYQMLDQFDESLKAFNSALDINYQSVVAWYGKAEALRLSGAYEDAIGVYQKVLTFDLEYEGAYWGIGECYIHLKEYSGAKKQFYEAIKFGPEWSQPYSSLGHCYELMADEVGEGGMNHLAYLRKAKEYYDQAIQRSSAYSLPYWGLAKLPGYLFTEEENDNISNLYRALFLALDPDSNNKRFNRSELWKRLSELLGYISGLDMPALPFVLFENSSTYSVSQAYLTSDMQRKNRLTQSLRTQFFLWNNPSLVPELYTINAVLNYYIGNPIETYLRYRNRDREFTLQDDYYFIKSATAVQESFQEVFTDTTSPKIAAILKGEIAHVNEIYYAALICNLIGDKANSLALLGTLKKHVFVPAFLKHDEFTVVGDTRKLSEESIRILRSNLPNSILTYLNYPIVINLNGYDGILKSVMPLIYFMENYDLIEANEKLLGIRYNGTSLDSPCEFFCSRINLEHLGEFQQDKFIRREHPEKHPILDFVQGKVSFEQIRYDFYHDVARSQPKLALSEMGRDLMTGATTQLHDLKTKVKDFISVDYRGYILLVNELGDEGFLSRAEVDNFIHYTLYCAKAVNHYTPETVIDKPIEAEVMDAVDEYVKYFFHISFAKTQMVITLLKDIYEAVNGREREILAYEDFVKKLM